MHIESGITTNYLLLPVSFLLLAVAMDAVSVLPRAGIAILAVVVGIDQWRGTTLDAARPTIHVDGIAEIRDGLQGDDPVVVQGAGFLSDGDRVRVVPADTAG